MPTIYQLATICAVLLGAVYLLIGVLRLLPKTSAAASRVWPDLKSATFTFGLTIGFLTLGGWFLKAFLVAVFIRVSFEAFIVTAPRINPSGSIAPPLLAMGLTVTAATVLGVAYLLPFEIAILSTGAMFAISVLIVMVFKGRAWNIGFEVLLFPLCPALIVVLASGLPEFPALALAAYIIVETFDGYALVGGKIWGKRPAFPSLSPHKTLEGLAIGAAATAVSVSVAGFLLLDIQPILLLQFTVLVLVLTVAGDLAGSALKRRSGVKDFPVVSQTQGGVLDVYDAWIAAVAGLGLMYFLGQTLGSL